jgi:hypothetical protein
VIDVQSLTRGRRDVVFRRNHEEHPRAFVGPQFAVIGPGVGVEKIAGAEAGASRRV